MGWKASAIIVNTLPEEIDIEAIIISIGYLVTQWLLFYSLF